MGLRTEDLLVDIEIVDSDGLMDSGEAEQPRSAKTLGDPVAAKERRYLEWLLHICLE
jgi:hypothetical protein